MNKPKYPIFFPALSAAALSAFKKPDDFVYKSPNLVKDIRFFNRDSDSKPEHYMKYPYCLWSAAYYYNIENFREELRMGDKCIVFLDSGGYQLKTGKAGKDFNAKTSLEWCEKNGDIYPILDKPVGLKPSKHDFEESLDYSCESAKYYYENQSKNGNHLLNVLSGSSMEQMEKWYARIKQWKLKGWAHGSHGGGLKSILSGIFFLLNNGELHSDEPKVYHIFGQSANKMMFYLALIQREINKLDGVNVQFTYDASSFGKSAAYGIVYSGMKIEATETFTLSNKFDLTTLTPNIPSESPYFREPLVDVKDFLEDRLCYYILCMGNNLWWTVHWKDTVDALVNCGSDEVLRSWLGTEREKKAFPDGGSDFIVHTTLIDNVQGIMDLFKDPKNAIDMINFKITDNKKPTNTTQTLDSFF